MSSIIPAMHWSAALHPRIRACSLSAGSAFLSRSSSGAANARLQLCSLQRNSQGRQALFEAQHVVKYRETRCGAGRSRRDSELDGLDAALHILEGDQWRPTLAVLAVAGAVVGPPMDAFHARVDLLIYDKLPITIGGWTTSLLDPPLLASYYAAAGALVLALDRLWPSRAGPPPPPSPPRLLLHLGLLAAYLQLSAALYDGGAPYPAIWATLAVLGVAGWRFTDGTKQGAAVGVLAAAVCPLAEAALMAAAGVWHYPRADLFLLGGPGVTSWVACCYAYYTVTLAGAARWLASEVFPPHR